MSASAVLEQPMIEDTLFGDGQLLTVEEGDSGPDGFCFCVCQCADQTTKISSYQLQLSTVAVCAPQP